MPLGMILRRLWRERALLGVLLLAMCLVTGFFALGPLYVRAIAEAGVRYVVENTAPEQLNITLTNPHPLGPEVWDLLNRELGGAITSIVRMARSAGVVCGFDYTLGEPTTLFTGRTDHCYQVISYSNLQDLFILREGRWPVRLPPPEEVSAVGLSLEQQAERQVGVFSRGQVEAVVTAQAAAEAGVEVGNRVVVGDDPGATAIVRIVGLVEPALSPDDPFWEGQRIVITGQLVPVNLVEERFDFGLIIPDGAYEDWIDATTNGDNSYVWRMETDPNIVHADTLDALEAGLARVQGALRTDYPDMIILSGLGTLVQNFRAGVIATEGPIVLLSGAMLVLMLYHLVTTVALILDQQSNEWSSMSSRGASILQLIGMQFFTVGVLGVVAFVLGPFIGQAILMGLERIGPLALALGGASLGVSSPPSNTFLLSLIAALASVVVLTLPAWPAARRSLLRLKQLISRPPTRPAWARYFLDVALLLAGLALLLRLYFLVGGDLGASLDRLIQDPASLIRLIAAGAGEGGLSDPFNLLGPALVLTGVALLWLRLFPLLMGLVSRLFRWQNGLTVPLALWSVERDPGHYAQLVLLLIGTLALGTASLALEATRDVGAWAVAQHEVGGYARLDLDVRQADPAQDWSALPGVTRAASILAVSTVHRAGTPPTTLFGVDPVALGGTFPDLAEIVAPLTNISPPSLPGLLLPEDTTALTVQVYAEPGADQPTQTGIVAYFVDSLGVPLEVEMTTADAFAEGRFATYTADLPDGLGRAPWRLAAFRLTSRRGDLQDFTHAVYLDDLAAVSAEGGEALLQDFEADLPPVWGHADWQFPGDLSLERSADRAAGGAFSLRIDYRLRRAQGHMMEPWLMIQPVEQPPLPVVVSAAFAEQVGRRTNSRAPLQVGDGGTVDLEMPTGNLRLNFRVVGIAQDFPTMGMSSRFVIAPVEALRLALNAGATVQEFYDRNQVWLELDSRLPIDDFRAAASGASGVLQVTYAWDRYNAIQREPLPNAITGMLFAGFWVSLGLSVLDFGFYLAVTARQRALSFAVLRAMGWEARNLWGLLTVEQAALVTPALLVGVVLGALLAYLLLPFLSLIGGEALRFPLAEVIGLLAILVVAFLILLVATAVALRRMSVHQVLRLGEE